MSVRRRDAARLSAGHEIYGPDGYRLSGLPANGFRRLDRASAMPAADNPDHQRDNQRTADHSQHPVVLADPGMMRNPGIFVQRRYRQHPRQHVRGRPQQDRQDVDGVKQRWRHAERARGDWHEGADRRHEARKEYRQRTPAMKERLALRHQARVIFQRPGAEDFALGAMSDPERRSIPEQSAG